MPTIPAGILVGGQQVDVSGRMAFSNTVAASPATAAETVVATVTGLKADTAVFSGVFLSGCASLKVGTSGSGVQVRIRTGTTAGAGTVVADSGLINGGIAAAALISQDIQGVDTAVTGGGPIGTTSYCLTVTVASASAASTISQTNLTAVIF